LRNIVAILIVLGVLGYLGRQSSPLAGSTNDPSTPRPAAAATTLLDLRGSGIKRSAKFTASGDWTISYTYDCASFGTSGNFIISVFNESGGYEDVAVNELAAKGSGTNPEYRSGTFYLEMNSECDWAVRVTG
jgi:hypothetical protein